MPSPETPTVYLDYFHDLTLHADPPAAKWAIGLQAAQLWKSYHSQAAANLEPLLALISVLMPQRFAGSGFYALWLTVFSHLRALPVEQQIVLWSTIFDPANHGERGVRHPERVEVIVHWWGHMAQQAVSHTIDSDTVVNLIIIFGPDLSTDPEWIALAYALDAWVALHVAEPSFIDLVFEQHNTVMKY